MTYLLHDFVKYISRKDFLESTYVFFGMLVKDGWNGWRSKRRGKKGKEREEEERIEVGIVLIPEENGSGCIFLRSEGRD